MVSSSVITRFAPSPTGALHLGGARTALFNWLYARHHGGRFLLRIEDTDKARSKKAYTDRIMESLSWLGLDWDGKVRFQSEAAQRHREIAKHLLEKNHAYRCFCSPEDLEAMREKARQEGKTPAYDGRCRQRDDTPPRRAYVLRLKTPCEGDTLILDEVQGESRFQNKDIDDFIILRSDQSPTWMLSLVIDDHDMGITHVIRGSDHLTNAARQMQIYRALEWKPPSFAHIPLIHGADGAKLSKRHGAMGLHEYQQDYLPEAMRNYLMRLGWSHGDEEIFSTEEAIKHFTLGAIGRSPARFAPEKLLNLNAHYLRSEKPHHLLDRLSPPFPKEARSEALLGAMKEVTKRAKTLSEVIDNLDFLKEKKSVSLDKNSQKILTPSARAHLSPPCPIAPIGA